MVAFAARLGKYVGARNWKPDEAATTRPQWARHIRSGYHCGFLTVRGGATPAATTRTSLGRSTSAPQNRSLATGSTLCSAVGSSLSGRVGGRTAVALLAAFAPSDECGSDTCTDAQRGVGGR
jgi:hypothetical protein